MAELGMVEAAAALGVSVDTIRRRIKAGALGARHDERGRLLVTIPDPVEPGARQGEPDTWHRLAASHAPVTGSDAAKPPPADPEATPTGDAPQAARAGPSAEHAQELLDEVRRQRDQLEAQVEAQRRQLDAAEVERSELRRLLALAMQGRALAEPATPDTGAPMPAPEAGPVPRPISPWGRRPRTRLAAWVRAWLGL